MIVHCFPSAHYQFIPHFVIQLHNKRWRERLASDTFTLVGPPNDMDSGYSERRTLLFHEDYDHHREPGNAVVGKVREGGLLLPN